MSSKDPIFFFGWRYSTQWSVSSLVFVWVYFSLVGALGNVSCAVSGLLGDPLKWGWEEGGVATRVRLLSGEVDRRL